MTTKRKTATLALANGVVFKGLSIGAEGETSGEVVFNTSMTGYQEILTDPSYAYQMITFTYPHIGNVGVNKEDIESNKVHATGMIVRELSENYSNYRSTGSLEQYLKDNSIVGISEIDTRELVIGLRDSGAQMGIISTETENSDDLIDKAKSLSVMEGRDLVKEVTTNKAYDWNQGTWSIDGGYTKYSEEQLKDRPLVVVIDCGVKFNILRLLVDHGFRVKVVSAKTSADEILKLNPSALFVSNGPGDPAVVSYTIDTVKSLLGKKPMFGICLGHQIIGLALNAPTFKLKFGHRGANHPVRNETTGKIDITSQNHGFATRLDTVPSDVAVSHFNLNDNTVSGFEIDELKTFSVQYHPEASPGPNDARQLFKKFRSMV